MKIYYVIPEGTEFTIYYTDLKTNVEVRVNSYSTELGALKIANHNNAKVMNRQKYKDYLTTMF